MRASVIRLRHGEAQSFFNMMSHPDPAILQARDAYFRSLGDNTPVRREGTSLVMDIPDDGEGVSLFSKGYTKKLNLSNSNEIIFYNLIVGMKITAYDPGSNYSFSPVLLNQNYKCNLAYSYDYFDGNCPDAA